MEKSTLPGSLDPESGGSFAGAEKRVLEHAADILGVPYETLLAVRSLLPAAAVAPAAPDVSTSSGLELLDDAVRQAESGDSFYDFNAPNIPPSSSAWLGPGTSLGMPAQSPDNDSGFTNFGKASSSAIVGSTADLTEEFFKDMDIDFGNLPCSFSMDLIEFNFLDPAVPVPGPLLMEAFASLATPTGSSTNLPNAQSDASSTSTRPAGMKKYPAFRW